MCNIAIYFDNNIDQMPFVISRHNGVVKIIRNLNKFRPAPNTITLGYMDSLNSLRRLNIKEHFHQRRLEILFALNIGYSKGDMPKKWGFQKQDIIGAKLPNELNQCIKKFDSAEIGWIEFSTIIFKTKSEIISAVEQTYLELLNSYINENSDRKNWIEIEYKIDSYFLSIQHSGLPVDRHKIEKLLKELNDQKYSSLLYLEKEFNLDISSSYLSDEYIDGLILEKNSDTEKTEELSNLVQVMNFDNKKIDAIAQVKECKIDYANLIKHYSIAEEQCIYPQYQTIGSSSGRIFIASPGTQYLKKSKRDIFIASKGHKLAYFDFRNYEPGIAAGLSNDTDFINYYNSGDMYLKIAKQLYNDPKTRSKVKFSILASLYGMSEKSLIEYFPNASNFNPLKITELLNSFNKFQSWKKEIINKAVQENIVTHDNYTRKFIPTKQWKIKTSALNHIIQSTGSVILKNCINKLIEIDGIKILIPMHDALLCEVKEDEYEYKQQHIINIMEKSFCDVIKNSSSKVIVANFDK